MIIGEKKQLLPSVLRVFMRMYSPNRAEPALSQRKMNVF